MGGKVRAETWLVKPWIGRAMAVVNSEICDRAIHNFLISALGFHELQVEKSFVYAGRRFRFRLISACVSRFGPYGAGARMQRIIRLVV
jgi:hypothetical protein